jgi:uncharacterized protein (TIGR00106 family)
MKVIADLCLVPLGVGVSLGKYVAECERILTGAGLKTKLHAYGTNIEGEWDDVVAAIKECHRALHAMGVPRINSSIRLGTRIDREQTMEDKIRSVEKTAPPASGFPRPSIGFRESI